MKTNSLIIGAFSLVLSFSACQNKTSKTNTTEDHSSMNHDGSETTSDSSQMAGNSPIMKAMDDMMKNMHQMQMSGNADNDLAMMLIHHHQGAVEMSQAELQSGTDSQMKAMAQKIVDMQQKEIQDLHAIADKYKGGQKNYDPNNKNEGLGQDLDKNMQSMMKMNHDASSSIDHEFASMMKKHHEDGLEMGEIIVKHALDSKFKSMAQKMIQDQKKDIEKLEQWLNNHKG